MGIGVYITVCGHQAIIASGGAVLLDLAVYLRVVIIYAPHIAGEQMGLVVVGMLQSDGKDHLLPAGLVAVEVAHGNGLDIAVGDPGRAAGTVVGAVEVTAGIYRRRGTVADIIESAIEKHQLLSPPALAVDSHRLHGKSLPHIIRVMVAAVSPAVGFYGPIQIRGLGKVVSGIGQFSNIHIVGLHRDLTVDPAGILLPGSEVCQHTGQEQVIVAVAVKIATGQRSAHGELIVVPSSGIAHTGIELLALCRGLADNGTAVVLNAVDDLDHGTVVVDLGLVIGQPVAVGQHRQVVHTVAVEVPNNHRGAQLAPLVSLRVFHVIPGMVVIIAHQQALALAPEGEVSAVTVVVPLLDPAAPGIVGLRGINHNALLAVAVEVTGHNIEEAAIGIGGHLKVISVVHIAEIADIHPLAAIGASALGGIDHPQVAPLIGNAYKGHMIPSAAAGGVEGYRLHEAVGGGIKGAVGAALAPGKGGQRTALAHIEIGGLMDLVSPDIQIHQLILLHHQEGHPHIVAVGVGGCGITAGLDPLQVHQVRAGKISLLPVLGLLCRSRLLGLLRKGDRFGLFRRDDRLGFLRGGLRLGLFRGGHPLGLLRRGFRFSLFRGSLRLGLFRRGHRLCLLRRGLRQGQHRAAAQEQYHRQKHGNPPSENAFLVHSTSLLFHRFLYFIIGPRIFPCRLGAKSCRLGEGDLFRL